MQKGVLRLCILGCILAALLSPATAYCAFSGTDNDQCHPVGLSPIQCAIGSHGVDYKPNNGDKRFHGADFSKSCLKNAGVACDDKANGDHPLKPETSCCSCFLYASYCKGQNGFVIHKSEPGHILLMPGPACTGIENWDDGKGCPGEKIWDEGEKLLSDASWGMAINPVSRRGQHQMHVHIAQVPASLITEVVKGFQQSAPKFYLNCGTTPKMLDSCTYSASPCATCLEVIIKKATSPSGVEPFKTVYDTTPDRSKKNQNALKASTLVLRVPFTAAKNKDTWAIVINPHGPAECAFEVTRKSCLGN